MDLIAERTLEALAGDDGGESLELSVVELVVAACEFSDDQGEISDLIDGLVETERVRLVRARPRESGSLRAA